MGCCGRVKRRKMTNDPEVAVTNAAMTFYYDGPDSPVRRFADADGVVTWWKIRWYGVPWPIRPIIAFKYAGTDRPGIVDRLPLCGCSVRLKALADRVNEFMERSPWEEKHGV